MCHRLVNDILDINILNYFFNTFKHMHICTYAHMYDRNILSCNANNNYTDCTILLATIVQKQNVYAVEYNTFILYVYCAKAI